MWPKIPKTTRPGYPESPCISTCTLDEANICIGCQRTLDEVIGWSTMTADQQWQIVRRLEKGANS